MSFLGVGRRSLELNLVSPIKCEKFCTFIFVNAHQLLSCFSSFFGYLNRIFFKRYEILKPFPQDSKICEDPTPEKVVVG